MPYYHLYLEWNDWKRNFLMTGSKRDLSAEQLIQFADPIKKGFPILLDGRRINPKEIWHFEIWETAEREQVKSESSWDWIIDHGENVTNDFITTLPLKPSSNGHSNDRITPSPLKEKQHPTSKSIFIVHGRDHKPLKELKAMLIEFGLNPIVLHEKASGSRTIIEKLEKHSDVGYAFVILTPDDVGAPQEAKEMLKWNSTDSEFQPLSQFKYRARQNVVLEFGYFIGKLERDRVCCLHKGDIELPSDMHGIVYVPFKESVKECRDKIIKELKAVGYKIEVSRKDVEMGMVVVKPGMDIQKAIDSLRET